MIDNLKNSGKIMAKAVGHGIAVGAASEGVNFAYTTLCNYLHIQFGIPMEKLTDPVNKELITAVTVALLHLSSSCLKDTLPGMDKIQYGCELVIEGKAKDHTATLIKNVGPLLKHVSNLMDPKKSLERLSNKMNEELKEAGLVQEPIRFSSIELDDVSEETAITEAVAVEEIATMTL